MFGQYKLRKSIGRRNRVKVGFNQSTVRKLSEVPILESTDFSNLNPNDFTTLHLDEISQNIKLPDFMCESNISMEHLRQLSYEIIKEL